MWTISCDDFNEERRLSDYLKSVAASTEVLNLGNGGSETPLYGCPGHARTMSQAPRRSPAAQRLWAVVRYERSKTRDRAWRVFHPNGDDETLTFLNLASGCGLIESSVHPQPDDPTQKTAATPTAHPNSLHCPQAQSEHSGWQDSESVDAQPGPGMCRQRRVGMRPEKADKKGKWFSLDACRVWITGAVAESTIDTEEHGVRAAGHLRSTAPSIPTTRTSHDQHQGTQQPVPEGAGQDQLRRR